MDNNKKQQVMTKLAQVRMAINHVLRKRAMQKQSQAAVEPLPAQPNWGNTWGGFFNALNPVAWYNEYSRGQMLQERANHSRYNTPTIRRGTPPSTKSDPARPLTTGSRMDQSNLRDRQLDPTDPSYGK